MGESIHKIIAAINPDLFCEKFKNEYGIREDIIGKVKQLKKEKGVLAAAKIARPRECEFLDENKVSLASPFKLMGIKNPIEKHSLSYDAFSENLEPIYFWIIDTLKADYKDFDKLDKLVDNFSSTPGSGHFSEMGQKATRMQDEGMKILGAINQVLKSILNIIYDLREFRIRLDLYDNLKDPMLKNAAQLSLKQIWMDSVDMKRGNTAIKGLAQQFQYATIIDAFMASDSVQRVNELDLNERVKRVVEQRVAEFFDWLGKSEQELRNRYQIEKNYLKSQYNTVQLYVKWAKPYLRAAQQLSQPFDRYNPDLVTVFNTSVFELTLMCQGKYSPAKDAASGALPSIFANRKIRSYNPLLIIELKFRSIPERAGQQGYGFRGKVDINFTSYALREDEIKVLKEELDKDDMMDAMKLIEGATTDSIEKIKDDVEKFINDFDDKKSTKKEDQKNKNEQVPSFSGLFSDFSEVFSFLKKDKKENNLDPNRPEDEMEKVARSQALLQARGECLKFYGLYKKSHNMPAF